MNWNGSGRMWPWHIDRYYARHSSAGTESVWVEIRTGHFLNTSQSRDRLSQCARSRKILSKHWILEERVVLKSSLFSDVTQSKLVDGNGHLGTTFVPKTWIVWPLKMGPVCCPETSITNYHSTRCNNSDERKPDLHLMCGSLNRWKRYSKAQQVHTT